MKPRARGKRSAAKQSSPTKKWASLTWDDLDDWAGGRSVSRGRSYQRQGRVRNLAVSDDGRLLATVQGGDRYVVSVWRKPKRRGDSPLQSRCTCPVGYDDAPEKMPAPPALGEHTESVLRSAGLSAEEIAELRAAELIPGD